MSLVVDPEIACKKGIGMIWRTTDFGANTFARAHVEMLAHDWGAPMPSRSEKPKRHGHRLHVTAPRHHHVALHVAHR